MPTPLAGGQENSFAPQMIFLWPPARGVGKLRQAYCAGGILFRKVQMSRYLMLVKEVLCSFTSEGSLNSPVGKATLVQQPAYIWDEHIDIPSLSWIMYIFHEPWTIINHVFLYKYLHPHWKRAFTKFFLWNSHCPSPTQAQTCIHTQTPNGQAYMGVFWKVRMCMLKSSCFNL